MLLWGVFDLGCAVHRVSTVSTGVCSVCSAPAAAAAAAVAAALEAFNAGRINSISSFATANKQKANTMTSDVRPATTTTTATAAKGQPNCKMTATNPNRQANKAKQTK